MSLRLFGLLAAAAAVCAAAEPNHLTAEEQAQGWRLLFDGRTTDGWVEVTGKVFPTNCWAIENACFVVAANQIGEHAPGLRSGGRSLIVDPWGIVLAQAVEARPTPEAVAALREARRVVRHAGLAKKLDRVLRISLPEPATFWVGLVVVLLVSGAVLVLPGSRPLSTANVAR